MFTIFSLHLLFIYNIFWGYIDNYLSTNLFDLRWRAFTAIDFDAKASRYFELGFGKFQNDVNIVAGKVVFVSDEAYELISQKLNSFFITGFFFGIIGPFVEETTKRPEFLPFLIEGIVILSIPLCF